MAGIGFKREPMLLAWDFDGVLVDTLKECHASYNAALADEGLSGLTLAEFSMERKTAVQATDFFTQYILRRERKPYTPENRTACFAENEALILELREHYHRERDGLLEKMFDQNPVYPGVVDTLQALTKRGVKMAVVSARDNNSLRKYLENKSLSGFFGKVVGSSGFFAKSHELKPLQLESLSGEEIWFVDDMPAVLESVAPKTKKRFFASWGYGVLPANAEGITVLKKPPDVLSYVIA